MSIGSKYVPHESILLPKFMEVTIQHYCSLVQLFSQSKEEIKNMGFVRHYYDMVGLLYFFPKVSSLS